MNFSKLSADERLAKRLKRMPEHLFASLAPNQVFKPREIRDDLWFMVDSGAPKLQGRRVALIGSCLARIMKHALTKNGIEVLERGSNSESLAVGSAEWDRVFNPGVVAQEIERCAADLDFPTYTSSERVYDPYRFRMSYDSQNDAAFRISEYKSDGQQVLRECELLVIAIAVSEVWTDEQNGLHLPEIPFRGIWDAMTISTRELSIDEVVALLKRARTAFRTLNTDAPIFVCLEPQPLRASLATDNVYIADAVSKARQLVALHDFAAQFEDVHYLPVWETVQYGTQNRFGWDDRHLSDESEVAIEQLFASLC